MRILNIVIAGLFLSLLGVSTARALEVDRPADPKDTATLVCVNAMCCRVELHTQRLFNCVADSAAQPSTLARRNFNDDDPAAPTAFRSVIGPVIRW